MGPLDRVRASIGFQWDEGNAEKSQRKHGVSRFEAEEVFFNQPLLVADDEAHSFGEDRFFALGKTNRDRMLFVAFTVRGQLIRVISARCPREKGRRIGPMAKRRFQSEEAERAYWQTHDSAGRVDWSRAKRVVLPELRPSARTISLRLPESMLEALKAIAHKQDVPYQSLIKVFLAERIAAENKKSA